MTTEELKSLLRDIDDNLFTAKFPQDFNLRERIRAALSSDFAVVPVVPTEAMATAACDISDGYENLLGCNVIEIYQAMIKVAEGK